jgi:anti-sigma factor RsiW
MGKFADGHVDEPSRAALEFDIERCEERDARYSGWRYDA